jgi:hypothetical protein
MHPAPGFNGHSKDEPVPVGLDSPAIERGYSRLINQDVHAVYPEWLFIIFQLIQSDSQVGTASTESLG